MKQAKAIEPSSPKQRVRDFLDSAGVKYADAEKMCGFTRGYLGAGGEMTTDKLRALKEAFQEIDITYVTTGEMSTNKIYEDLYHSAMQQVSNLNKIIMNKK